MSAKFMPPWQDLEFTEQLLFSKQPYVEDWGRTWAADRTNTLMMTSKRVKELVDRREDDLTGRGKKLPFVLRQLTASSACRIIPVKSL